MGYGLTSKKIQKAGFKFLYNLKHSLEEMYDEWKDREPVNQNELVISGMDNYQDQRGLISNYYFDEKNKYDRDRFFNQRKHKG